MNFTSRIFTLALVLTATPAAAQFFYSPPPALMGQPSYHLYSVAGAQASGALETYFGCTNTTPANIRVGVELFSGAGNIQNDPSASSLDVGPGASVVFGTSAAAWVALSSNLGASFTRGSARILATEKKGIICSAYLADPANVPPTSMADLKVIAKTKQRGE